MEKIKSGAELAKSLAYSGEATKKSIKEVCSCESVSQDAGISTNNKKPTKKEKY